MMDLGATLCVRRAPACTACPVRVTCRARAEGRTDALPGRKPRRDKPRRRTRMLVLRDADGRLLVQRRPPTGIWGGLWSFPECADDAPLPADLPLDASPRALPGFVQDLLVPVVVVSAVLGLLIYRQRKARKGND